MSFADFPQNAGYLKLIDEFLQLVEARRTTPQNLGKHRMSDEDFKSLIRLDREIGAMARSLGLALPCQSQNTGTGIGYLANTHLRYDITNFGNKPHPTSEWQAEMELLRDEVQQITRPGDAAKLSCQEREGPADTTARPEGPQKAGFDFPQILAAARDFIGILRRNCPIKGKPFPFQPERDFHADTAAFDECMVASTHLMVALNPDNRTRNQDDVTHILQLGSEGRRAECTALMRLWERYYDGFFDLFVGMSEKPAQKEWSPGRLPEIDEAELEALERAADNLAEVAGNRPDEIGPNLELANFPVARLAQGRPVGKIWEEDPVRAFEELRDRVCEAIELVCQVYQAALAAPLDRPLADVRPQLHDPLLSSLKAAQAIWFDTPIRRFLERPEAVYLDPDPTRVGPRVRGSCYHDLALGTAVFLVKCIEGRHSAHGYARSMRYNTAAGDQVAQHLISFRAEVASECQRGMEKWKSQAGSFGRELELMEGSEEGKPGKKGPARRKRGRPTDTNKKQDKRIYDGWQSWGRKNLSDYARSLGMKKADVARAIERHRKRLKRGQT